jgi:ribonuclease J
VELIRVTHAIPESSAISVQTPFGRLINTGDFRLDPEPLDDMPSDIARLKELGDEGVLMLMSESTNTTKLGRTPTEHTLQDSFYELVGRTHGRLIVAIFSTNMNRVQMIINAAHQYGRKVVLDGRSMYAVAELAVRLGNLKIPKGVLISMDEAVRLKEEELVVICTGGQGEPGAALSRMAAGEHRVLTLKNTDSVVISSTPIPGNERRYASLGDQLARIGVIQYRHPTHEIDGSGPLHVSGHAARDEHAEMIQLTRPTFLMPIYGGPLNRKYHRDIGIAEGIPSDHIVMADNGSMIELRAGITPVVMGKVTAGAHLVDQTGSVVPEIVTRDRLLLKEDGFIVIVLTVDKNGRVLSHPDILTRGCLAVKDNPNIIEALRKEMRTVLKKHPALHSRVTVDIFKQKLRIAIGRSVFQATQTVPIVIPVVNVVHQNGSTNIHPKPSADVH